MLFWKWRLNFKTPIWTWPNSKFWNHIDILVSYPFPKIEIEYESDPKPQVGNSISLFDSIMTPVSLSDFFSILESTLNPVPIHREIESPTFYDHILLMGKVCEHQFFGLDPIFEPILTPNLNLDLIWVKFSSRHWFLFLFHLSLNELSPKITLHCWTKVLNKITQELFLKIKN